MKEGTVPEKTQQREPEVPDTREESRTLVPPVDIFENKDGLVVVADLPGVKKEAADVRVENGILTLKAAAKSELPGEPLRHEYQLRNYFRQFQLSEEVDQEKIKAEMKHGVLIINLPKREETKPKQISVQVS
ncbi:MAG: Hsp20/alpha crystallin family protein [Candidatus Hydrogenedentota bacterium]